MGDYETSETGNWNIAQNWTNDMIFKPFYEASIYLEIAQFGCIDIEEDFMFSDETKLKARMRALQWARNKIEMGIRKSKFAIRNKTDRDLMNGYLEMVVKLKPYMNLINDKVVEKDKVRVQINEEVFEEIYNTLIKIFTDVTEPMNRNDLIFNYKEQFDPTEYKRNIKDRFVQGG